MSTTKGAPTVESPQVFSIETEDQSVCTKVKVFRSLQFNAWERELTISKKAVQRLEKLAPGATWFVSPPTPYRPKAIFCTLS